VSLLLALLACQPAAPVDTGFDFYVASALPSPDDAMITQDTIPELTFNVPTDPLTCTSDTIRLDALTRDPTGTDHTVDFAVPSTLSWVTDSDVQLLREDLLPRGWTYALTVRGGPDGCLSVDGSEMAGFYQSFAVP
jgi:hypothetical protein